MSPAAVVVAAGTVFLGLVVIAAVALHLRMQEVAR